MGHHLYDENKQLKARVAELESALRERRDVEFRVDEGQLIFDAVVAFIRGEANITMVDGNVGKMFTFVMPARKDQSP